MKKRLLSLVGFFLLVATLQTAATPVANAKVMQNQIGYVFGALGRILGPGSARVGRDNFEIGMISPSTLGVMVLARSGGTPLYGGFGFGLYRDTLGLYTEAGLEIRLVRFLDLRLAVTPVASIKGYFSVGTFVGVNLVF